MLINNLDNFYGVDERGIPVKSLRNVMEESTVISEVSVSVKSVKLKKVQEMRDITIYTLMDRLSNVISSADCRYTIAKKIMADLRKAWKKGEDTIDLTYIFARKFFWYENKLKTIYGKDALEHLFYRTTDGNYENKDWEII